MILIANFITGNLALYQCTGNYYGCSQPSCTEWHLPEPLFKWKSSRASHATISSHHLVHVDLYLFAQRTSRRMDVVVVGLGGERVCPLSLIQERYWIIKRVGESSWQQWCKSTNALGGVRRGQLRWPFSITLDKPAGVIGWRCRHILQPLQCGADS